MRRGDAVDAGSVRALVARDPAMHEVEQVIKPAAGAGGHPTVKLGLHPRYPFTRPYQGKGLGAAIRRRVLRHCSLLPLS